MAYRTQLPRNNEPPVEIRGGSTRQSVYVSLDGLEAVQRRQRINAALLSASCAVDHPEPPRFEIEDLGMLAQIARERNGNGNPLLRKQAVLALGQFRSLGAAETLWELASDETEHESVRVQAATALAAAAPRLAAGLQLQLLNASSALVRGEAARALAETGRLSALDTLRERYTTEEDVSAKQHIGAAMKAIGARYGVRVKGVQAARKRRLRKPQPEQS
jgi:HEAT repeat protein